MLALFHKIYVYILTLRKRILFRILGIPGIIRGSYVWSLQNFTVCRLAFSRV